MNLEPGTKVIIFIPDDYTLDGRKYIGQFHTGTVEDLVDKTYLHQYYIRIGNVRSVYHTDWIHPIGDNVTEEQIEAFRSIVTSRVRS